MIKLTSKFVASNSNESKTDDSDDSQGVTVLYSLPQCIQVAISLSILFTYALQFYVPIAIIWPKIVNRFGPFKWPVLSETVFRSAMCFLTCKYHIKLISKNERNFMLKSRSICRVLVRFDENNF